MFVNCDQSSRKKRTSMGMGPRSILWTAPRLVNLFNKKSPLDCKSKTDYSFYSSAVLRVEYVGMQLLQTNILRLEQVKNSNMVRSKLLEQALEQC